MTAAGDELASLPAFARDDVARYQEEARKYNHYDVQLVYEGFSVQIGPKGSMRIYWAEPVADREDDSGTGDAVAGLD